MLVIDQAEELWTLQPSQADAKQPWTDEQQTPFLRLLLTAATTPASPVCIILAMRADFLYRAAEHAALAKLIGDHIMIVSPLTPEWLKEVITKPAEQSEGHFQDGLIEELIAQVVGQPGALPLLEYTLLELWKGRVNRILTWDAFYALGGVEGALAKRADAILHDYYPTDTQRDELRGILLRLVQPGEGAADTRRRARLADLVPEGGTVEAVQVLILPLANERLLTTSQDATTDDQTVEIAHEALIRAWSTFRTWIGASREDLRLQIHIGDAASEWKQATPDNKGDFLWEGFRLAHAEEKLYEGRLRLSFAERAFVQASRQREITRTRAEQRTLQRLRVFAAVISALLLLALIATGLAITGQRNANRFAQQESTARSDANHAAQDAQTAATQEAVARADADARTDVARSQALGAESQIQLRRSQDLALLLAVQSGRVTDTLATDTALRAWLDLPYRTTTYLAHDGPVTGARWNHDERCILTWSEDSSARVWDVQSGQQLLSLAHDGPVNGASWNHDDSRILTWSDDKSARVWDAVSGQQLLSLAHDGPVNGARWNHDASRILTWSGDGSARVWDAHSGQQLARLAHDSSLLGASWNHDASRILTWSYDGSARVWDAQNGQQLARLAHDGPVNGASWNLDESRILTWSDDGTVKIHLAHSDDLAAIACRYAIRNLSLREWQSYFQGEPYQKTCANVPLPPSYIASIGDHMKNGALSREQALMQLQHAIGIEHLPNMDAATEAQRALDAYLMVQKK